MEVGNYRIVPIYVKTPLGSVIRLEINVCDPNGFASIPPGAFIPSDIMYPSNVITPKEREEKELKKTAKLAKRARGRKDKIINRRKEKGIRFGRKR